MVILIDVDVVGDIVAVMLLRMGMANENGEKQAARNWCRKGQDGSSQPTHPSRKSSNNSKC